jgi:tetratricopeptide (TPR) repeat protein
LQFNLGAPPPTELTPPRVDVITGPTAARLEQARALVADKNWNEAIAAYRELATAEPSRLVAADANRYLNLQIYCQMQLARLPADGLAAYRSLVDPLAERLYREGIANRDERQLRRIVNEMFASSWGDDALFALGEIALERADYDTARRYWEQISPLLRDPSGVPVWIALRDIDLDANWPEVQKRWQSREAPRNWFAYPDTSIEADALARLVLASIRAGDLARAEVELRLLRRLHPEAAGKIGGQQGPYSDTLERLIASAKEWPAEVGGGEWPTFAGAQTRCSTVTALGSVLQPSWPNAVALPKIALATRREPQPVRETDRPLSCFPIVVGKEVVFYDGFHVRAIDLTSGQPSITTNGILVRNEYVAEQHRQDRNDLPFAAPLNGVYGVPRCTLTAVGNAVYARLGDFTTTRLNAEFARPADRIVGVDLSREGLLAFQAKPPDGAWAFDGTPVGDGRRLWVAMRHSDIASAVWVACFDATTGLQIWRTSIGSADTPRAGYVNEITHNLLSKGGDRIYFNTNLGLVASLDTNTGQIIWLYRYERSTDMSAFGSAKALHFDRDPSPCLVHDGLVVVAPADSPAVFALDADTGALVWTNDRLPDVLNLLGVVDRSLIVGGNRLYSLDVRSGVVRFAWPESEHAGIRGMGRGLIAGTEVFWPTRDTIYVLDAVTGARSRSPISLIGLSDGGANLAAGHGRLIVASHDKIMALGPNRAVRPTDRPKIDSRSDASN